MIATLSGEHPFNPDLRPSRAARNQSMFREVNGRVEELADTPPDEILELVCECADLDCGVFIPMSCAEYRRTREAPTTFVVLPTHVLPAVERIVYQTDRYVVVQKLGLAGDIAEMLLP